MRVYSPVQWNSVKMEIFSPQNDRATELNVNFLLTITVAIIIFCCIIMRTALGLGGVRWLR